MKLFNIILFLVFTCHNLIAQESNQISIVYLHDGSMIKGQVVEDHAKGIVSIKIIDGTELVIPLKTVKNIVKLKESIKFLEDGKYVQTKGWYRILSMGTLTAWEDDEKEFIVWGASLFHLNIGFQFNQYFSFGGGLGIDIYDKEYLPLYADFRGYFLNGKFSPYYAFQIGYSPSTDIFNNLSVNISSNGGAMIHPSIGIRFASFKNTKLILEAGYKFQYDKRVNERWNSIDKIVYKRLALKFGILF
jgi:hypothetical protein